MNGKDWNGNGKREHFDRFMDYEIMKEDKDDKYYVGSSGNLGCGGIVVAIVLLMLLYFIFNGASWEAIETLLSFGIIGFFVVRFLFG